MNEKDIQIGYPVSFGYKIIDNASVYTCETKKLVSSNNSHTDNLKKKSFCDNHKHHKLSCHKLMTNKLTY